MAKALDLTNQIFGRLKVIRFMKSDKKGGKYKRRYWLCQCQCGNATEVSTHKLRSSNTISCNCYRKERARDSWKTKARSDSALYNLYYAYRNRANRILKLEFCLSLDDFVIITSKNCYYCGDPPSNIRKPKKGVLEKINYIYNGIDRVDNSKGYTLDNCVPCCKKCNRMKMDSTIEQFYNHIQKILNFKNEM